VTGVLKEFPPEKLDIKHSKHALRFWLRLLTTSTEIEKIVRAALSREFDTTLPRFDVLSALARKPEGLTMGSLSKLLMVSNGNVTGVVDRLYQEQLVERETMENDRRTFKVTITRKGADIFARMASAHEDWLDDMLCQLTNDDIDQILALLNKVRASVANRTTNCL